MKTPKESRITRTPAWVLSLIIGFLSIISAFVFEHVTIPSNSTLGIVGLIFYVVFIPVASFIISKVHPKSVWYTPFICNPVSVLGTIFHPLAWTTLSEYLLWVCSLGLTVLAAIIGAKIGKRRIAQAE